MNSRMVFKYWFGLGAPIYFFGALALAFVLHFYFGVFFLIALVWRVYDSFQTTCSRCPFYGTYQCGLPGKMVSLMMPRKTFGITKSRIKLHYYTDIIFIVLASLIYLSFGFVPALCAAIWPIGAWLISFGPKRYHGLMERI